MFEEPGTDDYRRLAERMLRTAKTVTDEKAKAELLDVAAAFVMLAEFHTMLEDCAPSSGQAPQRKSAQG
jgi:hypothetical protein